MKKIVIVGCGFAGLYALKTVSRNKNVEVTIIDEKKNSEFLPLLPDVIGGRIKSKYIQIDISQAVKHFRAKFVKEEVRNIDVNGKRVITSENIYGYDYLILGCGATNNFYGNKQVEKLAAKLYSVENAMSIKNEVELARKDNFVIVGGGYTGIEIATNIWRYYNKNKMNDKKKIYIVEKAPQILSNLSENLRKFSEKNLEKMGIIIKTGQSLKAINPDSVTLEDNTVINNSYLIWSAGVKAQDLAEKLQFEKGPQGRIKADKFLRVADNTFAVGDFASFEENGRPLRMAIQFSIYQGICAGKNIIRSIEGKDLHEFKPTDLGFIVPMANGRSCGLVFKKEVFGLLPTFMHYMMCVYRSYGMQNKFGIIRELIKRG